MWYHYMKGTINQTHQEDLRLDHNMHLKYYEMGNILSI